MTHRRVLAVTIPHRDVPTLAWGVVAEREPTKDKGEQIRSAAQRKFLRDGFARTTMDAIAAEAPVSKQTLYRYYSSKEELLGDCLRHLVTQQFAGTEEARTRDPADRDDLRDTLVGLACEIVRALMQPEYLALVRVAIGESQTFPQLGPLLREAVGQRVLRRVAAVFHGAHEARLADVPSPDAAARVFVGTLLTFSLLDGLLAGEGERRPPPRAQIIPLVDLQLRSMSMSWRE